MTVLKYIKLVVLCLLFSPLYAGKGEVLADFSVWKSEFREVAGDCGISSDTLDKYLDNISLQKRLIKVSKRQPEFSKPIWSYVDSAVSSKRIRKGRKLLAKHSDLLKKITEQYGVSGEYIIAIWGLETGYGSNFGRSSILNALATLAYGSTRKEFFQKELCAAFRLLQNEKIDESQFKGSWAGAMGHMQFMPSTFEKYAVDFDNDGRKDLWNNLSDSFASAANYLKDSGWDMGRDWAVEVKLPEKFALSLSEPTTWLTVKEWADLDVTYADGRPLNLDEEDARLYLPAGRQGPAFLSFRNFQVLKEYNNSESYVLSVGYLAHRIRGGHELVSEWPRKDEALSLTQKKDVQFLLTVLGYEPGAIDGRVGDNTRQALRNWQGDIGVPQNGYINEDVMILLK